MRIKQKVTEQNLLRDFFMRLLFTIAISNKNGITKLLRFNFEFTN
jgi:hypothetical protein